MPSTAAIFEKGFLHGREVVEEHVYGYVQSFEDSFDRILAPYPDGVKKKKRLRVDGLEEEELGLDEDEHEAETMFSTYNTMKMMEKRIKLLETELRMMSSTHVQMKKNMKALIKKSVNRASRLVLKATDGLLKANNVLDKVASTIEKFEKMTNLQCAQYEQLRIATEATSKFEGLPVVIKSQTDDMEGMKT